MIRPHLGSDLDRATQVRLALGDRMVEILTQQRGQSLTMEKQVAIIFAGTHGLLDDLPVDQAHEFETFFCDWLDRTDTPLLNAIRDAPVLSDALRDALTDAVQGAKAEFITAGRQDRDAYHEDGGES